MACNDITTRLARFETGPGRSPYAPDALHPHGTSSDSRPWSADGRTVGSAAGTSRTSGWAGVSGQEHQYYPQPIALLVARRSYGDRQHGLLQRAVERLSRAVEERRHS